MAHAIASNTGVMPTSVASHGATPQTISPAAVTTPIRRTPTFQPRFDGTCVIRAIALTSPVR
jgi:hypothetical protein